MKKDDLIKESIDTWTTQAANVKCTTKTASSASPSKTSSSNQLNATKIKYLLNPSSIPQPQTVLSKPAVTLSQVNDDADLPKIATPPLTVVSDLPTGMLNLNK